MKTESTEQRLKTENEVVNVLEHIKEQREHWFTLDNPRLVENYVEGKLQFLVLFEKRAEPGNQFVALFERALPELAVGYDVEIETTPTEVNIGRNLDSLFLDNGAEHCPFESARDANVRKLRAREYDEAVLVDVVKLIERPQVVIPSLVRFGSVDSIYSRLRHALYFSFTRGFVFCGTIGVDYGKTDLLLLRPVKGDTLFSTADLHQVPSEMVKGASQLLQSFPCNQRDVRGNAPSTNDIMLHQLLWDCIRKSRIWTDADSIRLTVQENFDSLFEVLDVLVGPCSLDADKVESFIGGREDVRHK